MDILIRLVGIACAVVTTWAGGGTEGVGGFADGVGQQAAFNYPNGVAVDASGTVWVADAGNNRIRKISPTGGMSLWRFTLRFWRKSLAHWCRPGEMGSTVLLPV